jgi:hypothetical protein
VLCRRFKRCDGFLSSRAKRGICFFLPVTESRFLAPKTSLGMTNVAGVAAAVFLHRYFLTSLLLLVGAPTESPQRLRRLRCALTARVIFKYVLHA